MAGARRERHPTARRNGAGFVGLGVSAELEGGRPGE